MFKSLVACASLFLALAHVFPAAAQEEGIAVGSKAPVIVVAQLDGKQVRITPGTAATAGRPMLIEFWATWCEFCERLEPRMKSEYAKYGDRVQFSAVAVNINQSPSRVARHVKDRSLAYPVYYDATGDATRAYQVEATSFVAVIDKNGRIVYTGVGDKQDLDSALRRVM